MSALASYAECLRLDVLLALQDLRGPSSNRPIHDESLFIVAHQTYELWFKQILIELDSAIDVLAPVPGAAELDVASSRLERVSRILALLTHQLDVLATIQPEAFRELRALYLPASGLQSVQFRLIECRLGVATSRRASPSWWGVLRPEERARIREAIRSPSLVERINGWLESTCVTSSPTPGRRLPARIDGLSVRARAGARRIVASHGDGAPPLRLLCAIVGVDDRLCQWRHVHADLACRLIGSASGTGGTTGVGYLRRTVRRHRLFAELAEMLPRAHRPPSVEGIG